MSLYITFQLRGINMRIIIHNPYRMLGVYANSTRREIIANKSKASAFLKVGKAVEFPLDLNAVLPPLHRTVEMLDEAEARLAFAKEQVKYAQFWFLKITPFDETAFGYIAAEDLAGAKSIWSKHDTVSSLQNSLVCSLIENNVGQALQTAETLYTKFGDSYIHNMGSNCTLQMTGMELLHQFIDTLGEEVGWQRLTDHQLDAETKVYISTQTVGPLIGKISVEVERAKKVDHKDSSARKAAGERLIAATKDHLQELRVTLPANDPQYVMIADKLGLEILQCGIDYYNNSEEYDAAHNAMALQKYAQTVVAGKLARDRCNENVKTLTNIINNLPPKEIADEFRAIKDILNLYSKMSLTIENAVSILNESKEYVQRIKNKLGTKDSHYLRISTLVVSEALRRVVIVVNSSQRMFVSESEMDVLGLSFGPTLVQRRNSASKMRKVISNAWDTFKIIDDFDLEAEFKRHYYKNRETVKLMCGQFNISTGWEAPKFTKIYEHGGIANYLLSKESSKWQAAVIVNILTVITGYWIYLNEPRLIDYDELWTYMVYGLIFIAAWCCAAYDKDDSDFDSNDLLRGGCGGALLLIVLFILFWIYKLIRIIIDGIKSIRL